MTREMQMMPGRNPDRLIEELWALAQERGDQSLRVRIQPTVLHPTTKLYVALPQVSWMMEVAGDEAVQNLRSALEIFFRVAQQLGGPTAMLDYMERVERSLGETEVEQQPTQAQ